MATILKNINPIDLDNRKIVGFKFPLNGDAVFIPTYETRDQIKANLINYLLTNKGERVFNPEFGADLNSLLFNVIDQQSQNDIVENIQLNIKENFPDVKIEKIEFNNIPDNSTNQIRTTMNWTLKKNKIKHHLL